MEICVPLDLNEQFTLVLQTHKLLERRIKVLGKSSIVDSVELEARCRGVGTMRREDNMAECEI